MTFEATLLPESEKEALCRSLLDEFGVDDVRLGGRGELIHGCVLPWGNHKDQSRNPTASLNYLKLTYKCLGCGSGGGLLWLIQVMRGSEGEGSKAARAWLNKETGLGQQIMDLGKLVQYLDALYDKRGNQRNPIPTYSAKVLEPWLLIHPYLTDPIEAKGRGIPVEAVTRLKLGYDSARDRIIIPHFMGESLVGWQARRLSASDPDLVKYRNSPDFPKDQSIYNYDYIAPETTVVEAPLSAAKHVLDIHIEATFGATLTERQLQLLSKHNYLVFWFDNDPAGWKATRAACEMLCRYTTVMVVESPWAQDAGAVDTEDAKELIAGAIPWSLWEPPTALYCYIHRSEGLLWEDCPCPKEK
jgi:hypothetical protein